MTRQKAPNNRGPDIMLIPVSDLSRAPAVVFGEITIDLLHRRADFGGKTVTLTALQAPLLYALLCSKGELVSREALYAELGMEADDGRALENHLSRLRKKLKSTGYDIVSHRGKGYVIKKAQE